MKKMVLFAGAAFLFFLSGCVYEAPLVEEALVPVDRALIGTWQKIPEAGTLADPNDRMVVLAFSKTECVVVCSPADDALYFRLYLVDVDGVRLAQLQALGVDGDSDKKNKYLVCRYAVADGILTTEVLNEDVVSADLSTPAALREALAAGRTEPELFVDLERYRKLED